MKKITLTLTAMFILVLFSNAQNPEKLKAEKYLGQQGELTFTFQIENENELELMTSDMSLINYDPVTKTVKAWANEKQFRRFENTNVNYQVPEKENEVDEATIYDVRPLAFRSTAATLTFPLSSYPTYAEYAQQMQDFEDDYPTLVEKISIGTTGQGDKELLFVKISDNVSTDEQEPKLMLTSSMHGDEIAGYPMMLTLIDYILTVYNDPGHADYARVQNLVENTELWINPNANPDGTYHNSATNTSVVNARRGNGNNIDLNRNYPDNVAGDHYDGNAYQAETLAFMALADAHDFVISANFHGGTELVNYPFDNAYPSQYEHADTQWYEYIGVEYATNCQTDANSGTTATPPYTNKASYMTDDDDWDGSPTYYMQSPGVTHGAEWYRVYGGRQDYMNYYHSCREVTIELSDTKILPESSLDDYWYYNRDALLDFLTQGTYGFRGLVLDATTNNPIEDVKVTVVGHDAYNSEIYTDNHGAYYRPIKGGAYDLLFESGCHQSVTVSSQSITDGNTVVLSDVIMTPINTVPTGLSASNVSTASATLDWNLVSGASYSLRYREVGAPTWTSTTLTENTFDLTGLTALTQYEAQVRSECSGGNVSAYSTSINFTTTDIIPCTGAVVSSFPYLETFDSGQGDWTQDAGDDGDWTLDDNGTQSGNTGPSDDITGNGNYFYTEASTNGLGSNATTILTSPCFDLTNLNNAHFTFYYHLYGTNMGSLDLEASTDDGNNWSNVFNASGNLGNAWNFADIDLSGYYGEVVKLRFIGTTGNGFRSDMAIDHIGLSEFLPDVCASNGNDTSDEFINRVQLNTLDNNNSGAGTTSTGYSDFTSSTSLTTNLYSGTQYSITITPQWSGSAFDEGYAVWIDYNKDGDFSDSGELVWSQAPSQTSPVTGTFTLPAPTEANYGQTRMRVSMKYNAIPTECESFGYGEVEDYRINILFDGLLYLDGSWVPSAPNATTSTEDILIYNGLYSVGSEISVNSISVNTGATIDVDKSSSVTAAGNIINDGEFILNSDSNEFSSLLVDGTVTGNIKYNRHVTSNAGGNDIISPPVSGEAFTSFIASNSNILSNSGQTLYLFGPFEKPANDYALYSNTETATLDAAKGYRAASTDDGTFTFTGTVTNTTMSVPIEKTGGDFAKWNLIGNPYTSYIKLSDFITANLTNLDPQSVAIYGYDANDSDGSVWTIWNMAYSDANPNSLIAPGQGFFVSSKDGGSNVSFTPSMRATGSSDDFIQGRSSGEIAHFILNMTSADDISRTDIYFKNNATLGLDIGYDAELFQGSNPSPFSLYSELTENGQDLKMAIQSIGFDDVNGNTSIPLGVNLSQGEQVSISMVTTELDFNVYLDDTLTNTSTLLNTSEYTFTANTDLLGTGRFYLRYEAETLSVVNPELENVLIYNDSNSDQIIVSGQLNEPTTCVLYDIQGREILKTKLDKNKTINTIGTQGFSNGVYVVQLANASTSITKKIIIR
ncbi:M14 family zinc carboxypeptidase [Psychroserpens sp. XS_ASV72]|uniref:M14 family zinc carboxypeptidase n=1 Tax=Psychroserpens sp. XS_ASV72 TaxID=3241293 RepID=UPI0035180CA3